MATCIKCRSPALEPASVSENKLAEYMHALAPLLGVVPRSWGSTSGWALCKACKLSVVKIAAKLRKNAAPAQPLFTTEGSLDVDQIEVRFLLLYYFFWG